MIFLLPNFENVLLLCKGQGHSNDLKSNLMFVWMVPSEPLKL